MTDSDLLSQYVREGDEGAFRDLVQRRVGLVYGAALRQLRGDEHRAQDVTQEVFARLARKAPSLTKHPSLPGWLYATTRYICVDMVRSESSRTRREQEAHAMYDSAPENQLAWDTVRPVIDDAICELSERDRQTVLARFFAHQSFAEIGKELGISENAAQKSLHRALDQLRQALSRRGVSSTAAGLGLLLANQPVVAVPAGLAAAAAGTALAETSSGIAIFMGINKIVLGAAGALAISGAVGFMWQKRANGRLQSELAGLQQQVQTLSELPAENKRLLSALHASADQAAALKSAESELSQARAEIDALKAGGQAPRPAKSSDSSQSAATPTGLISSPDWTNAGMQSPAAAYQTAMWAHREADVDALTSTFVFRPADKARVDELFARLPDEAQKKFGSPEKMIALIFAGGTAPAAFQVVSESSQDENTTIAHVRVQRADGRVSEADIMYLRGSDGWRMVVPANEVANQIRKITGEPQPK